MKQPPMKQILSVLLIASAGFLTACSPKEGEGEPDLRQVRVVTVENSQVVSGGAVTGEIRARIETDLLALEWSVLRVLAEENNRHNADAVVSALKVRGSLMQQRVTELQVDALRFYEHDEDSDTLLWPSYVPGRTAGYLFARASTIYGGALEVQKNIIAKLAFGL